jgi:hypothetical protein
VANDGVDDYGIYPEGSTGSRGLTGSPDANNGKWQTKTSSQNIFLDFRCPVM